MATKKITTITHTKSQREQTTDRLKERLLEALSKSKGIVMYACKIAGVSRNAFYEYMRSDSEFKSRVYEIKEEQKDQVEMALLNGIAAKNMTAIIFYLKTQAKDRGYYESVDIKGKLDIQEIDVSNISDDLKEQIAEQLLEMKDG